VVNRIVAGAATAGLTGSGLAFAPAVLIVLIVAVFVAYLLTIVLAIWFPGVIEVLAVLRGGVSLLDRFRHERHKRKDDDDMAD
jgi:hypothetical protein